MSEDVFVFMRELLLKMGEMGIEHVKPRIPSKQLQGSIHLVVSGPFQINIYIPEYWAIFLHDGRQNPIVPKNSKHLVWFENPREDPRLPSGRWPVRLAEVKKLTKKQYQKARAEKKLIVVDRVDTTTPATNFFLNSGGMSGFRKKVDDLVKQETNRFVIEELKKAKIWGIREELRISL